MDRAITASLRPTDPTIGAALDATDHGPAPALLLGGDVIGHADLGARIRRLARALLAQGLRRGQSVGVHMAPSVDRHAACAALWWVGGVVVPLDPDLPPARLMLALQGSGVGLVLHDAGRPGPGAALATIRHLTCADLLALTPADPRDLSRRAALVQPAHPAALIYGEGEQDTARGVVISQQGLLTAARGLAARYAIAPGARVSIPLSLNHAARLSGGLATLIGGGALCEGAEGLPLSHLILADSPADPMPPADLALHPAMLLVSGDARRIRALERTFPHSRIFNSYARAELSGIALCSDPRDPAHTTHTTVGRPLKGVEVMIVNPATGMDMLLYEVGEIWIRGAPVMLRYHDDPPASRKARDSSGFFKTGDMGYLDSEGRVILCRDAYAQI
ncbi:MAG: class I adenylate-forming enzyme family protein [Paracoccaceae bacterium]